MVMLWILFHIRDSIPDLNVSTFGSSTVSTLVKKMPYATVNFIHLGQQLMLSVNK